MKFQKNKFLTTVAAAALALAVGACSTSSDDDETVSVAPPPTTAPDPTPDPTPDPVPTALETAQADAAAAAEAAMTASTDAADAVSAAMTAIANLATMQTGATAAGLAEEASTAAGKAMMAYMHAKAASEAAAAEEDVTAAVEARVMAENAMASAVTYGMMATEKAGEAETAAMAELMIDGTMKSVGETSIDAMAGPSSVATGAGKDAQTVITGLIKDMNPMATGDAIDGVLYVPEVAEDLTVAETQFKKAVPYEQAAAERTFAIGKTLDSPDDMARLMLVTDYAGVNMVKVYAPDDGSDVRMGTKQGFISIDNAGEGSNVAADANNTALSSLGMFYAAGVADAAASLAFDDLVAAATKPAEVFVYTYTDSNGDRQMDYATLASTSTDAVTGVITYTYHIGHDITAVAAPNSDNDRDNLADETRITSGIPGPVAYQHLHFGVWASLGEAAKDGAQKVTGHGIGFVQSIGDGMTGTDMPSTGSATYNGDWVATVQAAAGGLALENGAATLAANFDKATVKATLDELATLEGSIDGSMFSGTKATVGVNAHGLTSGGKFSGSFDGGFYGAKAAEAGATFDFASTNGGAFRGAFGGAKEKP